MGRVSDIINLSRDMLSDPNKDRWSDAELLRILDEGQKQIVLKAKLLRKKSNIPLLIGIADYSTPSDCYLPLRFLIDGKKVDLVSHNEMDLLVENGVISTTDESWESYQGSPVTKVVYDKLNPSKFKVYPIVESADYDISLLNSDGDLLLNPVGITVGLTNYTFSSPYGILVDVSDDYTNQFENLDSDVDDAYGLCVLLDDNSSNCTIYYIKKPDTLAFASGSTDLDSVSDPEIVIIWDTTLKHYVVGTALRENKDTQNLALGNEELQLFYDDLRYAQKDAAKNNIHSTNQYRSTYNNGLLRNV